MNFLKKNSWTIDLAKVPSYVEWNGDWKYAIDRDLIRLILECEELDEFGNLKITEVMKNGFKNNIVNKLKNGVLHIDWSARCGNLGRRYSAKDPNDPDPFSSAGNLGVHSKYIKNTIFYYMGWVDYDMVKGHPSLLLSMAKHSKMTGGLPAVERYVAEFDNGLAEEMIEWYSLKTGDEKEDAKNRITVGDIKDLHNRTIYGGGHSKWVEKIEKGDEKKGKQPRPCNHTRHPKYAEFYTDIQRVINLVYESNPDLVAKVANVPGLEEWRKKNRTMSYFCGILENECLKYAYKYGVENGLFKARTIDLCYDGFTAPSPPAYTDMDFHINGMNTYILEKTGFSIKMKVKRFENVVQSIIDARRNMVVAVPVEAEQVVITEVEGFETDTVATNVVLSAVIEDDNEGANLIYQHIKDRFKFCFGNIFFKQNAVWVSSKEKVDKHLLHFILNKTNLQQMSRGKNPQPRPYSTNVSGARALQTALYAILVVEGEDNSLLSKFITTTRGRLCFLDGVLDMTVLSEDGRRGQFYEFDEEGNVPFEYYTPVQIERKFGEYFENPDTQLCADIEDKVFKNLFGVDYKKALKFLSRGVAGHFEDKAWSLYIGNRNCGKGVVDLLAETAIGGYKANVEAQNLLCNSNRSLKQDTPERQMAFALDFQFARLCFSQELPPPDKKKTIKVNADIIKKLWSGGDKQKAKRNYDIMITEFINMSRLIVMCNDCPSFTNDDALQTCCEFNSTVSFKTQQEIDGLIAKGEDPIVLQRYKVGDPDIKDKCRTDEWANAFVMLMVMNYQDFAVPCIDPPVLVEGAVSEEDDCEGLVDLRKFIITTFEITKSNDDFLKNDAIQELFEEKEFGDISAKKISIELKAIGLKNGKKNGARGWFGIKNRPKEEITDAQGDVISSNN